MRVSINQGGTLGFILSPESSDINVDFDFFIFGPNVACRTIGQAIRCSTTNPLASGSANNTTGINSIEIILNPASLGNYVFALDDKNGFYQLSNLYENVTMGFHTVYINDLNGCGLVQKVVGIVGAPKYFIPNEDGYNDT